MPEGANKNDHERPLLATSIKAATGQTRKIAVHRSHVSFTPETRRGVRLPAGSELCQEQSTWITMAARPAERSTRVLSTPGAHGTDNRAEVATLGGKHVLGSRRAHRIEPPLHDAILLKRPEPL
jgi:hypothetical protein